MDKFLKIALLVLFLSGGTLFLFNDFITTYNNEISNTKDKLNGVEFTQKIQNFIIKLQKLRGFSQFENNHKYNFDRGLIVTLKSDIKKDIEEIKELYSKNRLLQEKNYLYIFNDIEKLIDDKDINSTLMYQKVTYLIEQLKEKIYHLGFKSKLLLESDSDKYFLTDIMLRHLPNLMEIIGQVRAKTTRAIVENGANAEIRYTLQSSCMLCKEYQILVEKTINDISDNTKKTRLASMLEVINHETKNMQDFVKQAVNNSDISNLDAFEFFTIATNAIDKTYELYGVDAEFLAQNLEAKLHELKEQKLYGIAVGGAIVFIIIIIIFSTIRSYILYTKSEKKIKNNLTSIIQLKSDLEKCEGVAEISSKSLHFFAQKFNVVNGAIYLFNEENNKLYIASSYATNEMKPIIELGEGLIGEVGAQKSYTHTKLEMNYEKRFKIEDITVEPTHICTLPLISHDKLFGVLQVGFLQNSGIVHNDDFLYYIDMIIGFLRDAKNLEVNQKYIELIDKYVITSKTNKDGIVVDVSSAFCKISGYTKAELIGKAHSIVSYPDTPKEFYSDMWQCISSGEIFKGEIKNLNKQKQPYWLYLTITPSVDKYGNILGYSAIFLDITDKKKLEEFSITDSLTQLYNRRHFDENFLKELRITKREGKNLVLLIVDIDFFKQYNDSYGHLKGDEVLRVVANTMKELFKRANDYVYRLGGEEFAITFYSTSLQSAVQRANLLRERILALNIEHKSSEIGGVLSISSGVAFIQSECNMGVDELYRVTDQALYQAKKDGRNRVQIASIPNDVVF